MFPISSIAAVLVPKEYTVGSAGMLRVVFVGGTVAAADGAGLDLKASTMATAARTPRVATTSRVTPFRKPRKIRGAQLKRPSARWCDAPDVYWPVHSSNEALTLAQARYGDALSRTTMLTSLTSRPEVEPEFVICFQVM